MSKSVFIVTTGCYSDYGISAVFTSERLAQEYAARKNTGQTSDFDHSRVEEYPIEVDLPPIINHRGAARAVPLYIRSATAWDDESQQIVEDEPTGETVFLPLDTPLPEISISADRTTNAYGNAVLHIKVTGPDYYQVRKVYGERLARERALLLGL